MSYENFEWMNPAVLAQTQAGAAPAASPSAQPVQAVGMPGAPAATVQPGATPATTPAGAGAPQNSMLLWLMLGMMAVLFLPALLSGRKEKKRRAELLGSLKKQDRVQTHSGIIGNIVEISDTEVVLRVEEGRIRFSKAAIQGVIRPGAGATSVAEPKDAKAVTV